MTKGDELDTKERTTASRGRAVGNNFVPPFYVLLSRANDEKNFCICNNCKVFYQRRGSDSERSPTTARRIVTPEPLEPGGLYVSRHLSRILKGKLVSIKLSTLFIAASTAPRLHCHHSRQRFVSWRPFVVDPFRRQLSVLGPSCSLLKKFYEIRSSIGYLENKIAAVRAPVAQRG